MREDTWHFEVEVLRVYGHQELWSHGFGARPVSDGPYQPVDAADVRRRVAFGACQDNEFAVRHCCVHRSRWPIVGGARVPRGTSKPLVTTSSAIFPSLLEGEYANVTERGDLRLRPRMGRAPLSPSLQASEGGSSYGSRGRPPNTTGRAVPLTGFSEGVLGGRLQATHCGIPQGSTSTHMRLWWPGTPQIKRVYGAMNPLLAYTLALMHLPAFHIPRASGKTTWEPMSTSTPTATPCFHAEISGFEPPGTPQIQQVYGAMNPLLAYTLAPMHLPAFYIPRDSGKTTWEPTSTSTSAATPCFRAEILGSGPPGGASFLTSECAISRHS
ncbi:hypothetical protein THAOC_00082 [Thalassiosira oceanica]|uniref:DUF6743 domain-containing protein n=1 Tax=Thalassiosira oceanica TaxID=159749 RepID=K0TK32_THAOC|nr:hypothetical protein THAOC_00082 [Thalassiosira oceanica]|eukprot:EJK78045.1 hypothetical protein THAOC_00082 [Thalassiosira oceanica]